MLPKPGGPGGPLAPLIFGRSVSFIYVYFYTLPTFLTLFTKNINKNWPQLVSGNLIPRHMCWSLNGGLEWYLLSPPSTVNALVAAVTVPVPRTAVGNPSFWTYVTFWKLKNIELLVKMKRGHATCALWQYGLWSFQAGYTKLERFCIKINIPKVNYWIWRIGLMGSLSSLQKSKFLKMNISFFH